MCHYRNVATSKLMIQGRECRLFPSFLQVKKDDNRFHRTELLPGDRDNLAIQTRGGPEKHEVTGWVLVSSRSWQGSRWNQTQRAWQRRPVHCPAGSTHTELLLHFQMQLRTAEVHGMFGNDQQIRTNFFPFTSKQNSLRPDPRIKYFNQVLINSYFTWPLIVGTVDTHCVYQDHTPTLSRSSSNCCVHLSSC